MIYSGTFGPTGLSPNAIFEPKLNFEVDYKNLG